VVLTYTHVWVFERKDRAESFFSGRVRRAAYQLEGTKSGEESDSEAICFEDGTGEETTFLLADESRAKIYRVRLGDIPEVRAARSLESAVNAKSEHDIGVTSFNIRYASANDGENSWPLRERRVGEAIRAWNSDIIGLQEVEAVQADWLRALLPTHTFHGVGRTDGQRKGEFAPILFRSERFMLEESGHFWLSPTPDVVGSRGWDAALERMASWVRLLDRETSMKVLVINTHLDHKGEVARAESLNLIRTRAESLAKGAAIIITGDFNTSADDAPASGFFAPAGEAGATALRDTFRRVYPERDLDEGTFSTWNTPPRSPLTLAGARIDWVVTSGAFETISSEIDRRTPGGRLISDHYPVHARLRYTSPKSVAPGSE
jgi:endonuclease/exonuclease/phosphatase family metal-dependent hydrolase